MRAVELRQAASADHHPPAPPGMRFQLHLGSAGRMAVTYAAAGSPKAAAPSRQSALVYGNTAATAAAPFRLAADRAGEERVSAAHARERGIVQALEPRTRAEHLALFADPDHDHHNTVTRVAVCSRPGVSLLTTMPRLHGARVGNSTPGRLPEIAPRSIAIAWLRRAAGHPIG
jgi:hypothetical protein